MESTAGMKRGGIMREDDGLASIAEFCGNSNINSYHHDNNFVNYETQAYMLRRKNSLRSINTTTTTSSHVYTTLAATKAVFCSSRSASLHSPHFLQSCALCRKSLPDNRDIFMYRGDTPFCSEECREEQMEIDEAKEKIWKLKCLRSKKESTKSSTSPTKPQNYSLQTTTVAAA